MQRLAKTLKKRKLQATNEGAASSSSNGKRGLSLSSPITRLLAEQIGKGKPAHLLQKFASAAVEEAGAHNVSSSNLFSVDWLDCSNLYRTKNHKSQLMPIELSSKEYSDHTSISHVSSVNISGTRKAAKFGNSGKHLTHAEDMLHRSLRRSDDVTWSD